LAPEFATFLGYEGSASILRQFEQTYIPGLLQTEEYARALITTLAEPNTSAKTIDRQVKARLERQSIFTKAVPPEAFFILDEAVVRRWVGSQPGDPTVMRRQLQWLKKLGTQESISIQIVRFSLGAYFGLKGPFVILEFPDPLDDDLLFLEGARGNVLLREDAVEVGRYKDQFLNMQKIATSRSDLATFLDDVLLTMTS
jgi:hypothetical protein